MNEETTQKRVVYDVEVVCPNCESATTIEATTEDDEQLRIINCPVCEVAFVVRLLFYVDPQVYALKMQRQKRA